MNKLTFLIIAFFFSFHLSGQEDSKRGISYTDLAEIARTNPSDQVVRVYDTRYQGVRGTPLLWEEWKLGTILFSGSDSLSPPVEINIDLFNQDLFFELTAGVGGKLPADKVELIVVKEEGKEDLLIRAFPKNMVSGGRDSDYAFYEVLYDQGITLLKYTQKEFRKADFQGVYTTDQRYDEYLDKITYWIKDDGNEFSRIKLNKKNFAKALPDHEGKTKKLWKKDDDETAAVNLLQELEVN